MVRAMTSLKPQLVRADTLDLQAHEAPSAKDHTRQPAHPQPYGFGPAAPHQAQTIRQAEQQAYQQQHTSPRISEDQPNGGPSSEQHFYDDADDDHDDDHMDPQTGINGNGYHGQDLDDGEAGDSHDEDMDDDLMDKISSSPSIEDEDIDFEFVYALHTFVATVEGQANATKGDTMVLLDDSNSYWWLVRVVKDGSIGYLPAEHIETPTERLARLNKHRNVDLSASMLGDNTEKSKNPLKKAMRRRNAKTVQFSAPTYYEPSEYEYSDEEEEGEDDTLDQIGGENPEEGEASEDQQDGPVTSTENQAQVEPILVNGAQRSIGNESSNHDMSSSPPKAQQPQTQQEQQLSEETVQRSRKGVVRNTDSFFRDDTVETKKISLTPRLLRGDSEANVTAEQGVRERASLETIDKAVVADDKGKEKKKEKKGMLSGLFKRKKGAPQEENEKVADDSRQSPQNKDSLESLTSRPEVGPERKPSKLQKAPPVLSPTSSPTDTRAPSRDGPKALQPEAPPAPTGPAPAPPTVRKVESDTTQADEPQTSAPTQTQPAPPVNRFPSLTEKRSIFAPITTALKSNSSSAAETTSPVKAIYSKRAKERFAIDDSGSDEAEEQAMNSEDVHRNSVSPLVEPEGQTTSIEIVRSVSPLESTTNAANDKLQGGLPASTFYQEITRVSPEPHEGNPPESEGTASTSKPSPSTATHTPSTSRSTPTWSDASLRTYMENNQDIKDLLIIVHDNSNVTPVGPEHPLMHNLFSDERTKLVEMQSQLDDMLMNWISKKHANLLSGAT
ncbi:hypothetical protein EDD36DRAFT_315272 [Exophiala viscosa]|uniref:SH3 domain-containing protein n=1 Tax=Exophiala viscosa TaxID=2486360 RepID=A0AAN6DSC8_9EURO|nr:hypothetical protein EDD36DRAFT_315272 [Exophiala viscosa]